MDLAGHHVPRQLGPPLGEVGPAVLLPPDQYVARGRASTRQSSRPDSDREQTATPRSATGP